MPVSPEDLEPFVNRQGPVQVVHPDGRSVTYGTSARLDMVDPDRTDWTVDQVKLTLLDEQARPTRAIAGDRIIDVREEELHDGGRCH